MSQLTLYGHPDSGHACKVALGLQLAKLPHDTVYVDIWAAPETRPSDFLAASPLAEVPLLMIDGVPHVQSGAILLAIATKYKVLGGQTEAGLTRMRELLMWEANRIGMCLPQLKEAKRVNGEGFPDGAIEWLTHRFEVDRRNFARWLGDAPFFHGEEPGVGDCALWGYTQWVEEAGMTPSDTMSAWLERMRALPVDTDPQLLFPQR